MRPSLKRLTRFCLLAAFLWLGVFLWSGCRHPDPAGAINPSSRFVFPGEPATAPDATTPPAVTNLPPSAAPAPPIPPAPVLQTNAGMLIRCGEKITVTFTDLPQAFSIPIHEQRVREDGTITLPYSVTVVAAGKTAKQLEEDIRKEYVPGKGFKRLTVTVKTEERVFYVGGEVKMSARQPYLGYVTVTRAIQAAGDFTDFANRKKISLIRATGQKHRINWNKAIENPELDLEVFPGDQIIVHRRWF